MTNTTNEKIRMTNTENEKVIVVAGTFDMFHVGHKELLGKAYEIYTKRVGCDVYMMIGIMSDDYASRKSHDVQPYRYRMMEVIKYMTEFHNMRLQDIHIVCMNDIYSNELITSDKYTDIVATVESRYVINEIQRRRKQNNLKELNDHIISLKRNADGIRISSTRIRLGEMDRDGNTITK